VSSPNGLRQKGSSPPPPPRLRRICVILAPNLGARIVLESTIWQLRVVALGVKWFRKP
jgi:hypothetical protein